MLSIETSENYTLLWARRTGKPKRWSPTWPLPVAKLPMKCLWANSSCDGLQCVNLCHPCWRPPGGGFQCTGSWGKDPASLTQLPRPAAEKPSSKFRRIRRSWGWQRAGPRTAVSDVGRGWLQVPPQPTYAGRSPSERLQVWGRRGWWLQHERTQAPATLTHTPSGSPLQTTRQLTSRSHCSGFSETLKAIAAH